MKEFKTNIKGLIVVKPEIFQDERGLFFESYNKEKFKSLGIDVNFVQDNQSISHKNVLRGLHFQKKPYEQDKLVRVTRGSVLDVAVDLRLNSPTYGKWASIVLSEENGLMLFIPKGFAHGFLSLEDNTVFQYKCSDIYSKDHEDGLLWDDPVLNIDWGVEKPIVSSKDLLLPNFTLHSELIK